MAIDLPDDCWEVIFSHLAVRSNLTPVTLVCKRFLAISNHSCTTLTFPNRGRVPAAVRPALSSCLPALISRFPNLTHISLHFPEKKIDRFIEQLATSAIRLKSLCLSNQFYFPRQAMCLLGRCMRNTLRSLSFFDFKRMVEEDLFVIADCFIFLVNLTLLQPRKQIAKDYITDEAIRAISIKLVSLVSFNIWPRNDDKLSRLSFDYLCSHCHSLTELKVLYRGERPVELDWFASFKSLKTLKLDYASITDSGLVRLAEMGTFKFLSELDLFCPRDGIVSGSAMCQLLKSCLSLTSLHLNGFKFSLDTNELDFAASIAKSIKVVSIFNCVNLPNTMLNSLLESCPNLEEVRLPDCCNTW